MSTHDEFPFARRPCSNCLNRGEVGLPCCACGTQILPEYSGDDEPPLDGSEALQPSPKRLLPGEPPPNRPPDMGTDLDTEGATLAARLTDVNKTNHELGVACHAPRRPWSPLITRDVWGSDLREAMRSTPEPRRVAPEAGQGLIEGPDLEAMLKGGI